jgi:hypothetical protein
VSEFRFVLYTTLLYKYYRLPTFTFSFLGGIVVRVLATGPKGRGFKPAEAVNF